MIIVLLILNLDLHYSITWIAFFILIKIIENKNLDKNSLREVMIVYTCTWHVVVKAHILVLIVIQLEFSDIENYNL